MQCPKCGYEMGAFDKECERCKRMGVPKPKDSWAKQPEVASQLPAVAPPPVSYDQSSGSVNTSGLNDPNVPIDVLQLGWCWGGFMLTLFWGLANRVWISLVCLIPYVGWVVCFWLGAKGHEMAWRSRRFESIEDFKKTMRVWNAWGIGALVAAILVGLMVGGFMGAGVEIPGSDHVGSSDGVHTTQAGVTLAQYNQLQTGMSEQQVYAILGPGTEISRSDIGGIVTVMYQWDGDGFGANMNAMFQNGHLIQKAQFGLE